MKHLLLKASLSLLLFLGFSSIFACNASFTHSQWGNQVWINNNSTNFTSLTWQFSDGDTSHSANPNKFFATTGTHWACLSLYDQFGGLCDTMCVSFTVNCVARASYNATGLSVAFTFNGTTGGSYDWNFGDGNSSTQQNPVHSYSSAGTYWVSLYLYDSLGSLCDTTNFQITVSGSGSGCNATASFNTSYFGNQYWFTNTSTGNYAHVVWQFSNGDTSHSNYPSVLFNTTGTHSACLYLYDSLWNLCDSICNIFSVNCIASANVSINCLTVSFTYTGTPTNSFQWWFGDGNSSSLASPTHTYSSGGTYNIGLQITDTSGCTDTLYIPLTVSPCSTGCNATANFNSGYFGNWMWLYNNSSGSYAYHQFVFSDGDTSYSSSLNHYFTSTGPQWACLYLYDSAGNVCDSSCRYINVTCYATATYTASGLTANFTYTGSPAISYYWQFGDGNTSTQQNPSHTYASSGTYNVVLQIGDSTGPCDTVHLQVTVTGSGSGCNATASFNTSYFGNQYWFTNTSTGNYAHVVWQFSNGDTSHSNYPSVLFNTTGTHSACLYLYDSLWNLCDSICNIFSVNCIASANVSINCLTVSFTYTGTPTNSFQWWFGDGNSSSLASPTHTYSSGGTYNIGLQITDTSGCTDTLYIPLTVSPCSTGCNATASFNTSYFGNQYWFTNTSTGNYAHVVWQFSNGDTSHSNYPSVLFNTTGTHSACLYLYDSLWNLCDSICNIFSVNCIASANVSINCLTVSFTYTGTPTSSFQWWFGDGNSSSLASPTHTYSSGGTYHIGLQITDTSGCTDTLYIPLTVSPCSTGCNSTANFNHITQGSNTWLYFSGSGNYFYHEWRFSDGTSSAQMNPFKSWNSIGWKTVCLYLLDSAGTVCDSNCQSMYISCVSNFNYTVNGMTANFTAQASGNLGGYYWYFGDGTNSSQQNPSHTYSSAGFYTVCLYVNDSLGGFCDSLCQTVQIGGNSIATNQNSRLSVSAYPNPSNGNFTIQIPGSLETNAIVTLSDLLGKAAYQKTVTLSGGKAEIDPGTLASGTYILSIISGNRQGHLKLIIEKR